VIQEKTPLSFLAGEGDIRKDFNLIHFNESISQEDHHFLLELAPKETQGAFPKLTLTVDPKTYTILQVDIFDGLGNVTRTRFVNMKTNVNIPISFFQFAIPPGAEVIKMQETPAPPKGRKGSPK